MANSLIPKPSVTILTPLPKKKKRRKHKLVYKSKWRQWWDDNKFDMLVTILASMVVTFFRNHSGETHDKRVW